MEDYLKISKVDIFGSVLIYCIWWWADENKGFGGIIFAGSVENSAFLKKFSGVSVSI